MADLKLGITLLNEAIEREEPKREREERAIELAKAQDIAAKEKVCPLATGLTNKLADHELCQSRP